MTFCACSCGFQSVGDCLQKTLCRGTWNEMIQAGSPPTCGSIEGCASSYCTVLCGSRP
jgi:hypothetical protein